MGSQAVSLYSDDSDDDDDDDDDLPSPTIQHVAAPHRPYGGLRMLELPLPTPSSPRSKRSPIRLISHESTAPTSPTPDRGRSSRGRPTGTSTSPAARPSTSIGAKLASMMPKRRERVSSSTSQNALRDHPPSVGARSRSSSDVGVTSRTQSAEEVLQGSVLPSLVVVLTMAVSVACPSPYGAGRQRPLCYSSGRNIRQRY
jgi:hypothetical protein